jgi:hypothetical protein
MSHDSPIPVGNPQQGRRNPTRPRRWLTAATEPGLLADVDGGLFAYRRLALRVIRQAMHDVVGAGSEDDRQTAQRFLGGSPLLSLWCELADLDVSRVVSSAKRALALRRRNQAAMALVLPGDSDGGANRKGGRRKRQRVGAEGSER